MLKSLSLFLGAALLAFGLVLVVPMAPLGLVDMLIWNAIR